MPEFLLLPALAMADRLDGSRVALSFAGFPFLLFLGVVISGFGAEIGGSLEGLIFLALSFVCSLGISLILSHRRGVYPVLLLEKAGLGTT